MTLAPTAESARHLTRIENLSVLGRESHAASFDAGWWHHAIVSSDGEVIGRTPKERNRGEMMMLMVSELAEAHQGVRSGARDEHLPERASAVVETGDFLIRIGDFVHGFGFDLGAAAHSWSNEEVRAHSGVVGAMCAVADAMERDRRGDLEGCVRHLARAALIMIDFASHFFGAPEATLFAVAHEKIAYNRRRADHKHKNRVKEGGKAY